MKINVQKSLKIQANLLKKIVLPKEPIVIAKAGQCKVGSSTVA